MSGQYYPVPLDLGRPTLVKPTDDGLLVITLPADMTPSDVDIATDLAEKFSTATHAGLVLPQGFDMTVQPLHPSENFDVPERPPLVGEGVYGFLLATALVVSVLALILSVVK